MTKSAAATTVRKITPELPKVVYASVDVLDASEAPALLIAWNASATSANGGRAACHKSATPQTSSIDPAS